MRAKRAAPSNGARADSVVERLIELQALAQMQIAKADERLAHADERFARIEQEGNERFRRLEQAFATVMRMLEGLPDAVREKIGFATAKP